jgi:hypothetical protein
MTQWVKRAPLNTPLCLKLRILNRDLQHLSGFHKEEVVGVAHALPIES